MNINGACIQTEDGNWSKLHNLIWEALAMAPLSGAEFRCLMYLFRNTYGWKRKEYKFSMQELADATHIDRRAAIRAMQELVEKRVIYRIDNGKNKPATWGFNKYVEQWSFNATSDNFVTTPNDNSATSKRKSSDKNDTTPSDKSVTSVVTEVSLPTTYPKDIKDKEREGRTSHPGPSLEHVGQKPPHKKTFMYHNGWKHEYAPLFERLADVYRTRALIDEVQDDKAIGALQGLTIDMVKLGVTTVEQIDEIERRWYAEDFRGQKKQSPQKRQFIEFAASLKSAPPASTGPSYRRLKVLA